MLNVLVLCDDCWHPAETVIRSFKLLDSEKYRFDYVTVPRDILSKAMIRSYDVIVLARGNSFSSAMHDHAWFDPKWCEVMPRDFEEYISEGRGLLALHAGNTFRYESCPEMVELLGNEFVSHPPQCPVTVSPVKEHPICKGVKPFTARDEHYILKLHGTGMDFFLESRSDTEAGVQPSGYTKEVGGGRLCVLTPGHTLSALSQPEYLKLISNAIDWCARLI